MNRFVLAAVLLVEQAVLLFSAPGLLPVWTDELFTIQTVQKSPAAIVEAARGDIHPPLYYLLAHAWPRQGIEGLRALAATALLWDARRARPDRRRMGGDCRAAVHALCARRWSAQSSFAATYTITGSAVLEHGGQARVRRPGATLLLVPVIPGVLLASNVVSIGLYCREGRPPLLRAHTYWIVRNTNDASPGGTTSATESAVCAGSERRDTFSTRSRPADDKHAQIMCTAAP